MKNNSRVSMWGLFFLISMKLKDQIQKTAKPFVIAGPCSAESEAQVYETCRAIAENGSAQILRAGIWKPRTRPDSFEGVGAIG